MTLQENETVRSLSGNVYVIDKFFSEGGQATLYTEQTGQYLVKVYDVHNDKEKKHLMEKFSYLQKINLPDNFIKIVDVITEPCVGLVLEKLDEKFCQLPENLARKMHNLKMLYALRERLVKAAIIAKAFRQLHYKNLAYCDISPSNIMVKETERGTCIKIIDIDNIYVPGFVKPEVIGTPRYMAPEVAQGTVAPDILSDNFSLGAIIFEILRMGNPYVGQKAKELPPEEEDKIAATAQYGYVDDDDPALMPADDVFTLKLKYLARRCFTSGRTNRMERPSSEEWEEALFEASNQVLQCPQCGEYTYAPGDKRSVPCCNSACGAVLKRGYVLRFYNEVETVEGTEKHTYYYQTGKEFVLRHYLGKGKFESNRIRNFYLRDLQVFPYNMEVAKENDKTMQTAYLELTEVVNDKQERSWYYYLKGDGSFKSCEYECDYKNERRIFPLEHKQGASWLENFKPGVIFRFEKYEKTEENGKKYSTQRIAKVEE